MLMGKYQNSIDQKNRIIIPAKFRGELGLRCVLTKGIDKCLYIYPMSEWENFMKKLSALPSTDVSVRAFLRHFYAYAVECEIDKQGRITLPQELREYAGIQKEVLSMGIMDKIELWSKEEWDNPEESVQLAPSEFAQKMAEYGI